jgi:predicted nucleic acid-binding protein
LTPDTSVVIAGFADWHPNFERAHAALDGDLPIAAHVALEGYSTLTRLPDPFRVSAGIASEYMEAGFAPKRLTLPDEEHDRIVGRLAERGVSGGAVYDALVALTAAHHKRILLTLDRRAESTYKRLGVGYEML